MMPAIQCSMSNISTIPVTAFTTTKNKCVTRCSSTRKYTKHTISLQRFVLPLSSPIRFFSQYPRGYILHKKTGPHILSATGIDVAVEESDSPAADDESSGASDTIPSDAETTENSSTKSDASPAPALSRRSRTARKSEMPPVKNEELIAGAEFTGKVRSIQPFGAFVDFGAFTDGLVHVSRLSDNFVKDVGSFVSVGQEVKVRLIEANTETGRISLTMRESDDTSKLQQQKDTPVSTEKVRPTRKSTPKSGQKRDEVKTTKFVKGQDLEGTVKNLARAGAFISLPEGEEGFLPTSEEADDGFANMMGGSSLQVGQEVSVRVLRISRGQITLTMKKEEDAELVVPFTQGVVHVATNPFVLAFRKNKDIAAFLDERDKGEKAANKLDKLETRKEIEAKVNQSETGSSIPEMQDQPAGSDKVLVGVPSAVDEIDEDDEAPSKEKDEAVDIANKNDDAEIVSDSSEILDGAFQTTDKEMEESSKSLAPEEILSTENQVIEETSSTESSGDSKQVLSSHSPKDREVTESQTDDATTKDEVQIQTKIPGAEEKETGETTEAVALEGSVSTEKQVVVEVPSANLAGEVVEQISPPEDQKDREVMESQTDDATAKDEVQTQTQVPIAEEKETGETTETVALEGSVSTEKQVIAEVPSSNLAGEIVEQISPPETPKDREVIESQSDDAAAKDEVQIQTQVPGAEEKETGETTEAVALEGSVFTGKQVIAEVPSSNLAGEIVEQISPPEGPEDREVIESQSDDTAAKDEVQMQTQIPGAGKKETGETTEAVALEGSVSTEKQGIVEVPSSNLAGELVEQISPPEGPKVEEVVRSQTHETIAKEEEQIQTPAAESEIPLAAPLGDEVVGTSPDKNGSTTNSGVEPVFSSSQKTKAAISPALVKQLREETGAGMMDCKKALKETGGDIIKAQELLRKKGLASAEKKASRATAEGRIGSYIHDSRIGVLVEVNCETDFVSRGDIFKELVDDLAMQVAASPLVKYLDTEDVPEEIVNKEREIEMQKEDLLSKPEQIRSKIVEGRIRKRLEELALLKQPYIKNDKMVVEDWVKQTIATIGENIKVKRFVRYNLGEGLEKKCQDFAAEVAAQTAAKPLAKGQPAPAETNETVEKPAAKAISAALVKQLREQTGAGMMDCKKALSETGGDLEKAQEYLRKKGLSTADKKSSRLAAEGRIGSYIHDSRIGVLIEVNCETDFVGRSEKFKELVDDLAMQVVACPQVQFVSTEDIPEQVRNKEKELEMQREDLLSKSENIREKIVEGRVSKRFGELALLEQPFIKNDSILVKDLVKQTVAALGENIKVRRFVRFMLGESDENA